MPVYSLKYKAFSTNYFDLATNVARSGSDGAWSTPYSDFIDADNNNDCTKAAGKSSYTDWIKAYKPVKTWVIPDNEAIVGLSWQIRVGSESANGRADAFAISGADGILVQRTPTEGAALTTAWPNRSFDSGGGMVTYGGPTDDWGAGLTPADVNHANFGMAVSGYNANTSSDRWLYAVSHMELLIYTEIVAPAHRGQLWLPM